MSMLSKIWLSFVFLEDVDSRGDDDDDGDDGKNDDNEDAMVMASARCCCNVNIDG